MRWLASRLRVFFGNKRRFPRHRVSLPFIFYLPPTKDSPGAKKPPPPTIVGKTRDVSLAGLGLIMPAKHIDERLFANGEHQLRLLLNLPTRSVTISAAPVHYHKIETPEAGESYLVGVRIIDREDKDLSLYRDYVGALN